MTADTPQTTPIKSVEISLPNYFVSFGQPYNHASVIASALADVLAAGDLGKRQQIITLLAAFAGAIKRGEAP